MNMMRKSICGRSGKRPGKRAERLEEKKDEKRELKRETGAFRKADSKETGKRKIYF